MNKTRCDSTRSPATIRVANETIIQWMSKTFEDHAALYDLAFSWDTDADAEFLLKRLGPRARVLLEPGCGSGRMFPALAERGISLLGVDRSSTMLRRARKRMRAADLPEPTLMCADMVEFDFGRQADGAYCPIGGFGYLPTREQAAVHLETVARHLVSGSHYLIQNDLQGLLGHEVGPPDEHSTWEFDGPEGSRMRCSCFGVDWDPVRRIESQICRFEVLSGVDAGAVFEDTDDVMLWDWPAWNALIRESPFEQVGAYDARRVGDFRPLHVGPSLEGVRLVWHDLRKR